MTQNKLTALKEYINKNLAKNFIKHSKSYIGALILSLKKKDGLLQMCVDYISIPNKDKIKIGAEGKHMTRILLIFGIKTSCRWIGFKVCSKSIKKLNFRIFQEDFFRFLLLI